jgi:hypothetical protein
MRKFTSDDAAALTVISLIFLGCLVFFIVATAFL